MKRIVLVMLVLCGAVAWLDAQEAVTPQRDPFIITIDPKMLGADLGIGYRGFSIIPEADTVFWLIAGGSYEWLAFYRLPDNTLYTEASGYDPIDDPPYTRLSGRLDLGIAQGLAFNESIDANLFEIFLFYKTRYDYVVDDPGAIELILESTLPDRRSIFQNSLFLGLSYNDLNTSDPHLVYHGIYGEMSAEWGPKLLFNNLLGKADFVRLNATVKGFLPLFDLDPESTANTLSAYAGAFFAVDYIAGDTIPINIQQTIGGRYPRPGLGRAVRGFEDFRFDGLFKTVLNLEFRLNLPQYTVIDTVTPGLFFFFDSGYYNFIYYNESGFLFSLGAGVYVNVWKLTSLHAYTALLLNRPRADGSYWVPLLFLLSFHF
ncbi:MAG TPA: hypothetical protein ENN69_06190 [Spirochaetia bacterium]|nr:hypothetical protein [Spirochaetia bacterium]